MAYSFDRFFRDAGNTLGQAVAGGSVGAQAGGVLGSVVPGVGNVVGGAVGAGTGFVGGLIKSLFDNSASNTAQDAEERARQQAVAAQAAQDQSAKAAAEAAAAYQNGLAERYNPLLQRLDVDAAKLGLTRDQSFTNRLDASRNYQQGVKDSNQVIEGLQGQGVFNSIISNLRNEANPFAAQGAVDTAVSARAGADFANQSAKLRSDLASRGMLGGPGEIAAMAALNAQQGASMFDTGVERILAETDFNTNRNQQERDYMQAGGDRADRMALAKAEVLRDPTMLNTYNNIYQQDTNNAAGANQALLQGNQAYSQAQLGGVDSANAVTNTQGGVVNRYIAEADRARAEQERINKEAAQTYAGLSSFITQMPPGVPGAMVDAAGRFSRFLGGSMAYETPSQNYQPQQSAQYGSKPKYNAGFRYSQPSTNPRPGVGGRQAGGAGLPYQQRGLQ